MPERSVSEIQQSPSPSHTSTEQWQSFEMRMRKRRAERCLARAHAAIAAGQIEDARGAWSEARELDPDTPLLPALEPRAEIAASHRQRSTRWVSIAACLTVLALAASVDWRALATRTRQSQPSPQPQVEVQPRQVPQPQPEQQAAASTSAPVSGATAL